VSVSTQSNSGLIAANLNAVMREDSLSSITSLLQMSKYIVNGTPSADPARVLPPNSADCHAALPWLGLHRGRGAVKNFLAHMHRNFKETTFGPREMISEGNKAAAFGWFGRMPCPLVEPSISQFLKIPIVLTAKPSVRERE